MIVVDTSVWIGLLRAADTAPVTKLKAIESDDDLILIGDVVLLEVLQGARNERHAENLRHWLSRFQVARMLDETASPVVARNYRLLRDRGVTIRKTIDLIIGTFCIEAGHALLHDDRDFVPMIEYLGLRSA